MVRRIYVPERGDIVWLDFGPTKGHEQSGRRPALVISPRSYNGKTHLALVCPITLQAKGYNFEVPIAGKNISGVVLADHIRNIDWEYRRVEFIGKASGQVSIDVHERLLRLIEIN